MNRTTAFSRLSRDAQKVPLYKGPLRTEVVNRHLRLGHQHGVSKSVEQTAKARLNFRNHILYRLKQVEKVPSNLNALSADHSSSPDLFERVAGRMHGACVQSLDPTNAEEGVRPPDLFVSGQVYMGWEEIEGYLFNLNLYSEQALQCRLEECEDLFEDLLTRNSSITELATDIGLNFTIAGIIGSLSRHVAWYWLMITAFVHGSRAFEIVPSMTQSIYRAALLRLQSHIEASYFQSDVGLSLFCDNRKPRDDAEWFFESYNFMVDKDWVMADPFAEEALFDGTNARFCLDRLLRFEKGDPILTVMMRLMPDDFEFKSDEQNEGATDWFRSIQLARGRA